MFWTLARFYLVVRKALLSVLSFALFLNWTDDDGGDTGTVQGAYLTAAQTIFTLIRDRLSR